MNDKKQCLIIFMTMLKLGAVTFGGGYVMVSYIEDEFVRKRSWISEEDMVNMVALSSSVPGVIAVNCSILLGYKLQKLKGALLAVLGVILPSIIIITVLTFVYEALNENVYVAGALRGVRAAVVALLVSAFLRFTKPFRKDAVSIAVMVLAFCFSVIFGINVIFLLLGAIVFGVTVGVWRIKNPPSEPKEDAE